MTRDDADNAYGLEADFEAEAEELDPLPTRPPKPDPVEQVLNEIDLGRAQLSDELLRCVNGGYELARQTLRGRAATADERNVLGWACAWTAFRHKMPTEWVEAATVLRGARDAEETPGGRDRAENTLALVIRAARLQGYNP